jgi:molybdopterin synthase sulfur carrier subunit
MTILLFGVARDIVGTGSISLSESESRGLKTVGDLKAHLVRDYPKLEELSSLAIAVNQEYAREADLLDEMDEIALIPPVSGG